MYYSNDLFEIALILNVSIFQSRLPTRPVTIHPLLSYAILRFFLAHQNWIQKMLKAAILNINGKLWLHVQINQKYLTTHRLIAR